VKYLAPRRHREQALVRLARLLHRPRVHVEAQAAAVDLTGAQLHEPDGL
jgi:hypothetical protein